MENNFKEFMQNNFTNLDMYLYLEDLFENLDQFYDDLINGKSPRLIVNMPPRTLKSESISVRFPAYVHSKEPSLNIVVFTTNQSLAEHFWKKNKVISLYYNNNNLKYFGLNKNINGFKFDLIIIDDSIRNPMESESLRYKYYTNSYIKKLLEQHLNPNGGFINVESRWCKDDTTGFLTEVCNDQKWKVLKYPAINENNIPLTNRFKYELVREKIRNNIWQTLYLQEPVV